MDATGGEAATAKGVLLAGQRQQDRGEKEAAFSRLDAGKERQMPTLRNALQAASRISQRRGLGLTKRSEH
jgi:hypothetical protein